MKTTKIALTLLKHESCAQLIKSSCAERIIVGEDHDFGEDKLTCDFSQNPVAASDQKRGDSRLQHDSRC